MFGKKQEEKEKIRKVETFISQHTEIKGIINSKGSLRLEGVFEGTIEYAEGVILGETGSVKGDINAQNAIIGGKITGNITVSESIEILSNAQVYGDIKSNTLSIAEGAVFEGNCTMTRTKETGPENTAVL